MAMKKSIFQVQLVKRPGARSSKAEDDSNHARLDDGAERLIVVDAVVLREPANHPSRLVAGKGTVRVEFVFENPLARHNVGAGGTRDEAP
jgi:hypothetical protein